jgi:hypothetical protein
LADVPPAAVVSATSTLSSALMAAAPGLFSLSVTRVGRRETGEPCEVLAAASPPPPPVFLERGDATTRTCSGSPAPNILIETSAPPLPPLLLLSVASPKDPVKISPPSSTWEYCDRPRMRPVSSSKAESGAGRKLADESCIPNLLEFGVLVLCISKASPAFSIAALISVCLSVCLSVSPQLLLLLQPKKLKT